MFRIRSSARRAMLAALLSVALPQLTAIRFALSAAAFFCMWFPQIAASQTNDDLGALSLENLLSTEVTSVSRHQEELRKTPAAVYVVTQDDIRRSGATDLAEVLRMVPGLQVAQINSNVWGVGSRGFAWDYAPELLVLVDGRTVYDPTFSGVFWRLQNLVVEDIDRIEVIRGPGATMWGANAVNGVINITTKKASNTQGGLFVADAGTGRPGEGSLRFGGKLGKTAFYRVFGRQTTRSSLTSPSGANGLDSWNMTDGGFRLDWNPSKADSVTVDFDSYRGMIGNNESKLLSMSPAVFGTQGLQGNTGGHILTRWNHSFRNSSNLTLQTYYDVMHLTRNKPKDVSTVDFDLQYNFKAGTRNDVMVGFGRRRYRDDFHNDLDFAVHPNRMQTALTSGFAQDEIALVHDKLYLTLGTKAEHNSFAGDNVQPSVHLAWLPTSRHSAWISASRAVRNVSRIERGIDRPTGSFQAGQLPGLVETLGTNNSRSEGLIAYEAGYRYQANRKLWLDVASFYNVYDHLRTVEPGSTYFEAQPSPAHIVLPLYFGNAMRGESYGAEATAQYKFSPAFTVKGSYSAIHLGLHGYNGHVQSESNAGRTPQHQVHLESSLNLPKSFEVSSNAYIVSSLPTFQIPAHTRLDINIGWKGLESLHFNLIGQNLLGSTQEFGDVVSHANIIRRSVFGKITWNF